MTSGHVWATAFALTMGMGLGVGGCEGGVAAGTCEDTCPYARDGACDDGRDGSVTSVCDLGSDCADCGPVPGAGGADPGDNGLDPASCLRRVGNNTGIGRSNDCSYKDDCAPSGGGLQGNVADDGVPLVCYSDYDCGQATCSRPSNFCDCKLFDFETASNTWVQVDFGAEDPCAASIPDIVEVLQTRCGWVPGPDRAEAYEALSGSGSEDAWSGQGEPDTSASSDGGAAASDEASP